MVSESKFQMWRGTVALVHVDNIVSKEEKQWLNDHLKNVPFTKEQKEILQKDFKEGLKIDDILLSSLEPRERGMLVSFANTIFKRDGLVASEEAILNDLTKRIMGNLNIDELTTEVKKIEDEVPYNEENIFKKLITIVTSII